MRCPLPGSPWPLLPQLGGPVWVAPRAAGSFQLLLHDWQSTAILAGGVASRLPWGRVDCVCCGLSALPPVDFGVEGFLGRTLVRRGGISAGWLRGGRGGVPRFRADPDPVIDVGVPQHLESSDSASPLAARCYEEDIAGSLSF